MTWWTTYTRDLRLHSFPQIRYWNDLRSILKKRYVSSYYDRELMQQLHGLTQRDMIVEQYKQKMELLMLREESRLTISRFPSGRNYEIRDKVELLS